MSERSRAYGVYGPPQYQHYSGIGGGNDDIQKQDYCNFVSAGPYTLSVGGTVGSWMTDYVTPPGTKRTFNALVHTKKRGHCVNNIRYRSYAAAGLLDLMVREQSPYYWVSPNISWGLGTNPPNVAAMYNELAEKLNGAYTSQCLLPVTLCEAGKTIRMLKNPFGLLKADWRKIAGNLSLSSLSKAGANLWLEGIYGWKAAYSDMKGISNAISETMRTNPADQQQALESRFSVSHTEETQDDWQYSHGKTEETWIAIRPDYFGGPQGPDEGYFRIRGTRYSTWRVGCRQVNDIARRWGRFERTSRAFGLTPSNVLDVLWELTPYSFVIDWFVDPQALWHLPETFARLHQMDARDLHYSQKIGCICAMQMVFGLRVPPPWEGVWGWDYKGGGSLGTANLEMSAYMRTLGAYSWPQVISSCTGSGLSALKSASGISLILQRALK